ncbi:NAD-dependent epimerase/dehydratase family protein [Geomonas nitrogeniifigens]|uniref:NAD-dependent epimerase/dehydratase family protein n=1 Tax=Geomonas diazotrophica TaxID=2843197 RepID=UPI001C2C4920|nr:NAD-dependent epimerase/dehydratase family protein [Geomonas nitrogeniifigens]QXE88495.1 NAD-dependent epimerase/dehydratase family protein [Geomonas nitrogeniifigens]
MRALVTGGGGFLGSAIVRQLRARGDEVVSFSRGEYPELASLGVEQYRGDLADLNAVVQAAQGCDTVFHVAAKAGIWGSFQEYYLANVVGTENVIAACRILGIRRLVYTGSPSVVFDGSDVEGGDESLPYPAHFEAHYPHSKALAEKAVLAANSRTLSTVSLRPHLIWGPGDNHLVPRIVAKGRAGALRRIGTRTCLVDTVFVDNAAEAHLNAADRLCPDAPLAGKAYFISNGEPIPLWDMVNAILGAAGVPPVNRTVPAGVAYAVGVACEVAWKTLKLSGEPPLTRFVAKELATSHWFDISAARRDLGYSPRISTQEGLKLLRASFEAVA